MAIRLNTSTKSGRKIFVDGGTFAEEGLKAVTLDSATVDSRNSPTTLIDPGQVVGETSNGDYIDATDANVTGPAPAAITSSSHSDGNGTIKLVHKGGTISVTTTTSPGTEANNATDLNADADFAAHFIATSGGGELTITAIDPENAFYIHTDTMATASFSEGVANESVGSLGEYGVVVRHVDMLENGAGSAVDQHGVVIATKGYFNTDDLNDLEPQARAFFEAAGSTFEAAGS